MKEPPTYTVAACGGPSLQLWLSRSRKKCGKYRKLVCERSRIGGSKMLHVAPHDDVTYDRLAVFGTVDGGG